MLIRNATACICGRFQPNTELRIHNGCVREIGHGLENGLYEDVLDLHGDYLLPGFVYLCAALPQDAAALRRMKRALYREGVAVLAAAPADKCSPMLPAQRLAHLIHNDHLTPEEAVRLCTTVPAGIIGDRVAGRLVPGAPAPLTRWSQDWLFLGILD